MVLHSSRAFPDLLVNSTTSYTWEALLSVGEKGERNVAQPARGDGYLFGNATNLRRFAGSVNCPGLVQ